MLGADVLARHKGHAQARPRLWEPLKQLSDRTPLRTKLITSVLVLVAMALVAISIATTYMVRAYLIGQHDPDIALLVNSVNGTHHIPSNVDVGFASPTHSDIVVGLQRPGSQLNWEPGVNLPFMGNNDPLPQLPTSGNWVSGSKSLVLNVPAQSGPDTWRSAARTDR